MQSTWSSFYLSVSFVSVAKLTLNCLVFAELIYLRYLSSSITKYLLHRLGYTIRLPFAANGSRYAMTPITHDGSSTAIVEKLITTDIAIASSRMIGAPATPYWRYLNLESLADLKVFINLSMSSVII